MSSDPSAGSDEEFHAPIFIVGVGRSGTSLVQSILAAHSQLAIPPETHFIRRFVATNRIRELYRSGGRKVVSDLLCSDRYLVRLGLDVREVLKVVERERGLLDGVSVYTGLMRAYARREGKSRFGDKDPRSIEYLPVLSRFFPRAFIIHVIRDPRDVLASKKKAEWSSRRSSFSHIAANAVQFQMGLRDGVELFRGRYLEIRYEELLLRPEEVVSQMARRLMLPEEDLLASYSRAAEKLVANEEMSWKKETLGPLLRDNAGKWREGLTPLEHVVVEIACADTLHHGSYMPEADRRSAWIRMLGSVLGYATHVLCRLYPWLRRWSYRKALRGNPWERQE